MGVEGIIASIFFPLSIMFYKNIGIVSFFIYSMLAWITTWIIRKVSVNIYLHLKEKYNWENKTYHITI